MPPKISAETRVKLSTRIFFNKVLRKILLRVEGEFRVEGSGVTIERSNGNRVKLSTWVSLISYLFLLIGHYEKFYSEWKANFEQARGRMRRMRFFFRKSFFVTQPRDD